MIQVGVAYITPISPQVFHTVSTGFPQVFHMFIFYISLYHWSRLIVSNVTVENPVENL